MAHSKCPAHRHVHINIQSLIYSKVSMTRLLSKHMALDMHFMADSSTHKSDVYPKMQSAETIEKVCLRSNQYNKK